MGGAAVGFSRRADAAEEEGGVGGLEWSPCESASRAKPGPDLIDLLTVALRIRHLMREQRSAEAG